MLKHGEVNPLNVHLLRRTKNCPPHFTSIDFDLRTNQKNITDWIYENLSGRFWFGDYYEKLSAGGSLTKRAAFEDPSECTYFILFLDQINKQVY